jgi:hypothetical protein
MQVPLSSSFGAFVVLLVELLNAASSIHNLLGAGVERVALGANFNVQRLVHGGLGLELVATAASYGDLGILRVNVGFHLGFPCIKNLVRQVVRTHKGADYP